MNSTCTVRPRRIGWPNGMFFARVVGVIGVFGLLGLGVSPRLTFAQTTQPQIGDAVRIHGEQPLEGPVVLSGYNVSVDQAIVGDVWILGNAVEIKQPIKGTVTIVARDVRITQPITGNLTVAAVTVVLESDISGIASILAAQLSSTGTVGTLYGASAGAVVSGSVDSAWILVSQAQVQGKIRELHSRGSLVAFGPEAEVELARHIGRVAPLVAEGGSVGTLEHKVQPFTAFGIYKGWSAYAAWFISNLLWLFIGVLALWRYRRARTLELALAMRRRVFSNSVTGVLTILITGTLILGFIGTRVGIHVAVLAGLVILILAHYGFWIFAVALGSLIGRLVWREQNTSLAAVLVGSSLLAGLFVVPLVSNALIILGSCLGIGTLTRQFLRAKLAGDTRHDRS